MESLFTQKLKIILLKMKTIRYGFNPLIRAIMLISSFVFFSVSIYSIMILIPRNSTSILVKVITVLTLYASSLSLYKHLFSLNSVEISDDNLNLIFLCRKSKTLEWAMIKKIGIFNAVKHYFQISYFDVKGSEQQYINSLAFPGIMKALILIHDLHPEIEMNDLLLRVISYKKEMARQNSFIS